MVKAAVAQLARQLGGACVSQSALLLLQVTLGGPGSTTRKHKAAQGSSNSAQKTAKETRTEPEGSTRGRKQARRTSKTLVTRSKHSKHSRKLPQQSQEHAQSKQKSLQMTPKRVLAQQFGHFSCQNQHRGPPRPDPPPIPSQKLGLSQNLAQNLDQIRFGFTQVRHRGAEMGFSRIRYQCSHNSPTPHFSHYQCVQSRSLKTKSLWGAAGKFPRLHTLQPPCDISLCKATAPQLPYPAQEDNFQPKVTNPGREEPAASGKIMLEQLHIYGKWQYPVSTILRRGAEVSLLRLSRSPFLCAWDSGFAVLFGGIWRKALPEGVSVRFAVGI
ncbi:Hypothetical_protein [Hexamita inflata]|uniref:Hypothetical_protein n=1 Tax=Hexamita inflata TaxID=28002 RepID=A0AA86TZV6_9EUKA|nr:Hypothetical protein HINF_LOCUS14043 [Hexamita inflata]